MLGGHLMRKLGQPALLGKLLDGMLVATLAYYFHKPLINLFREGETVSSSMSSALTRSITLAQAFWELPPATAHTQRLAEILSRKRTLPFQRTERI
jgi:hypothetical protein